MNQEKKLQILTKLRKEDPKLVKHMMSVEDFSSLTSERDALRAARMKGMLKFLFTGSDNKRQQKTTRLETETEDAHLQHIIDRAKKNIEPEAETGMQDPLAMMEGKIRPGALKKIILEEINSALALVLYRKK
tara:strand:- start:2128 stop:2523 length:396 start_codon:yes stop_codon:yes gene_type:complete